MDPEDEAAAGISSDEDEFYDRTTEGGRKAKKGKEAAPVEDAASLFGKKVSPLTPWVFVSLLGNEVSPSPLLLCE